MAAVRWRAWPGELPLVLGRKGRGERVRRKGRETEDQEEGNRGRVRKTGRGRMIRRKGRERGIRKKGRGKMLRGRSREGMVGRKGREKGEKEEEQGKDDGKERKRKESQGEGKKKGNQEEGKRGRGRERMTRRKKRNAGEEEQEKDPEFPSLVGTSIPARECGHTPAQPWLEHPAPLTCPRGPGTARGGAGTGGHGRHGSPALPLRCPVQALLLRKETREKPVGERMVKPVGKGTAGMDVPTVEVTSGGQRAPAEVTSCCSRSALE